MGEKVAVFCHNIGPYHAARYRELAKLIPGTWVIQLAGKQAKYPWTNGNGLPGLRTITVVDQTLERISASMFRDSIQGVLDNMQPDLVVTVGYADSAMRHAAVWAKKRGRSCVMMTATWQGLRYRSPFKEVWKRYWCRTMYDALFLPGVRSEQYYSSLGFPHSRIWRGVDVVDNEHFRKGSDLARNNGDKLRVQLGLPQDYFVCVARHSPEKNLMFLLKAFGQYQSEGGHWGLVLVGDGPQRGALEAAAGRLGLRNVKFAGWLEYGQLPAYYGLSNALVLPSTDEPWGLAVNEAMASGLPIIISRKCGCVPELCWRGINGYDFEPNDHAGLAGILSRISSPGHSLRSFGEASRRIIAAFSPESWAASLSDCIRTLLAACPGSL